ncbi:NADH dehydrogenase [ubiquinone] iron-sulfur protein 6, mitochondrial isoform X2 [Elaeis guineensis]|uniref:NADH dehydrogenase [ubiquinone] iron-sulfur protein 6, mitochondrial isoform X2 n=1 Tax=Elaeis guineensis var. tenera TaxID=51953 RepID=A0A6I9SIL4_ELAGV|nr:NADH dehydrogenase [ubiquinone] iron-sulfur protein 6, mitochondrial isoform X2 [Elaeis guineensis]
MATKRVPHLLKTLDLFHAISKARAINMLVSKHTAKWMQDTSKKSPMESINEVRPIKVEGRIVACGGGMNAHNFHFIMAAMQISDRAVL